MAQIPTSSITMAAIATELGISTSSITLDNCRANSNAFTMSSTSVPGHTRDGNEQTNTNASPWNNTMAEWAGYTHTQDFATPTYYAKTGTVTGDWCIHSASSALSAESNSWATVIFYATLNSTTVECYMVPDHTQIQQMAVSESASWKNASGTLGSFTGNFSSGFTPIKIAELNTGSVSGRQVSITTGVINGVGTYDTSISGYTNVGNGTAFTPSSTKNMRAPAANAWAACYQSQTRSPYHYVEFRVSATGYNTKVFNKFITRLSAQATSNNCM